jgi:hypothetical protein
VIGVHTFAVLFLRVKIPRSVMWVVLPGGWVTIGTIVFAGPLTLNTDLNGPFFGISGYWCWVTEEYPTERVTYVALLPRI